MKVFYNSRSLTLAETGSREAVATHGIVHRHTTVDELRNFVMGFAADENVAEACIVHPDVSLLRRDFLSLYRVINAAGGLIHDGNGEYLVIDRRGVPDLPKGKAEPGESDVETAMREVEEETGLRGMNILDHIADTFHTYPLNGELVLKRTAWFSMSVPGQPKLTPQAEEQITDARWVPRAQMREEAMRTYESLRDIFLSV